MNDRVWSLYAAFVRSRPGGFAIASMMRPPEPDEGSADVFVERARAIADVGGLGHHTHFTSPTHARPSGGDPAARVRAEIEWFAARGLRPTSYCGGAWYTDVHVLSEVADAGYTDCTATAWRPPFLEDDAERASLAAPAWVTLPDGRRVLEVPTTHSAGMAARALWRSLPPLVHVHFHDYELLDRRRARLLALTLRLLAARRRPMLLADVTAQREVSWESVLHG